MFFKADLKDDVLRSLIIAQIRATGLQCKENKKYPSVLDVSHKDAGVNLEVSKGAVVIDAPSFVDDFVTKNPASRILIVMILLLAGGAFLFSIQLVLVIPLILILYFYIFWRTYQETKQEYEANLDLYNMVKGVLANSYFLKPVLEEHEIQAMMVAQNKPKKKKMNLVLQFLLFLIVLFGLGAYFVNREVLVFMPILVLVYVLVSIKLYKDSLPPKPQPEPEPEEEEETETVEEEAE